MNGEWYDCHDPAFIAFKANARRLLARYNSLPYDDRTNRDELLAAIDILGERYPANLQARIGK
jgi:hypothetical protein